MGIVQYMAEFGWQVALQEWIGSLRGRIDVHNVIGLSRVIHVDKASSTIRMWMIDMPSIFVPCPKERRSSWPLAAIMQASH